MNNKNAAILALCTAIAACAMQDEKGADDSFKSPVYRTGSNIPAGRESAGQPQELSPAERRALEQLQDRPRNPIGVTN